MDRNFQTIVPDCRSCIDAALGSIIGGVRLRDVDESRITTSADGRQMCLLAPSIAPDVAFGEIAVFREGDVPVAQTTAAGEVQLRTIILDDREQAVLGSSYFLTSGPHMALLHHESSYRFVRDYLNWLLRAPIGPLAQEELVQLMPLAMAGGNVVGLQDVKTLRLRGEVVGDDQPAGVPLRAEEPRSFSRFIDRRLLSNFQSRELLRQFGLTDGTLGTVSNQDLGDLEFELIVRKREKRNLEILPDSIIQGVFSDGLDMAAEFQTAGSRRRGNAVVMSHSGEVDLQGAYFEHASVRHLLLAALAEWRHQGLI